MRLLTLIEEPDHVCYRYRVQAFEPALRQFGWSAASAQVPRVDHEFLQILPRVQASDVVILQRRLLPSWRLELLREHSRTLIYDIDDAVYSRDSNAWLSHSGRRQRRFRETVRAADAVWAGNDHLAAVARAAGHCGLVTTVPTCVSHRLYPQARHQRQTERIRIAWIGSRSTMPSLNGVAEALHEASRHLPGLELHVICDAAPRFTSPRVVLRPWSSQTEGDDLAGCDIGLSWLPAHPWSLGKCGLKVLQYMAAGLPVVARRYAIDEHLVSDGTTGLLVDDVNGCVEALCQLARSPQLRQRMGAAGRRVVESQYSVSAWSPRIAHLLGGFAADHSGLARAA